MTSAGFNHISSQTRLRIAMVAVFAGALIWAATPAGAQGTPEQRQACQPDAMRLCSDFIPDVEKITACMAKNRLHLSSACRVYFAPARKRKATKRTD